MTLLELASLLIAAYTTYVYVFSRAWFLNNIFAICFTIYTIENWLVGSFRYILVIFSGLILYDMFFVYHSDVMMTVA